MPANLIGEKHIISFDGESYAGRDAVSLHVAEHIGAAALLTGSGFRTFTMYATAEHMTAQRLGGMTRHDRLQYIGRVCSEMQFVGANLVIPEIGASQQSLDLPKVNSDIGAYADIKELRLVLNEIYDDYILKELANRSVVVDSRSHYAYLHDHPNQKLGSHLLFGAYITAHPAILRVWEFSRIYPKSDLSKRLLEGVFIGPDPGNKSQWGLGFAFLEEIYSHDDYPSFLALQTEAEGRLYADKVRPTGNARHVDSAIPLVVNFAGADTTLAIDPNFDHFDPEEAFEDMMSNGPHQFRIDISKAGPVPNEGRHGVGAALVRAAGLKLI